MPIAAETNERTSCHPYSLRLAAGIGAIALGLLPSAPASAFSPDEFFEPTPRATGEAGLCPTGGQGFSATFSNPAFLAIETGNKVTGSANTFFRAKTKITFNGQQDAKFEIGTSSFSGSLGGTGKFDRYFADSKLNPTIGYGIYTPTSIEQNESRTILANNAEFSDNVSVRAKANLVDHKAGLGMGVALTNDFLLGLSLVGSRAEFSQITSAINENESLSNKNKEYSSSLDRRSGTDYRAGAVIGLGLIIVPGLVAGVSGELTLPVSYSYTREVDEIEVLTDAQGKPLPETDSSGENKPLRKQTRETDQTASIRNSPQKIRAGVAMDLNSIQLVVNVHFRSDFVTQRSVTTRWEIDPHLILRLVPDPNGYRFSLGIRRTGRASSDTFQFWEFAAGATHEISEESEIAYGVRYLYGKKEDRNSTTVNSGILMSVGLSSRI